MPHHYIAEVSLTLTFNHHSQTIELSISYVVKSKKNIVAPVDTVNVHTVMYFNETSYGGCSAKYGQNDRFW